MSLRTNVPFCIKLFSSFFKHLWGQLKRLVYKKSLQIVVNYFDSEIAKSINFENIIFKCTLILPVE